jgi:hypothetical protein
LPDAERESASRSQLDVEETFRREGLLGAMRKFAVMAGLDFADREADAKLPTPTPQRAVNLQFFLTSDAPAVRLHELDRDSLRAASKHLVVGVGRTSGEHLAGRCAKAIAHWLGSETVEFPGGHNGFITHPRAFAERLREVLSPTM